MRVIASPTADFCEDERSREWRRSKGAQESCRGYSAAVLIRRLVKVDITPIAYTFAGQKFHHFSIKTCLQQATLACEVKSQLRVRYSSDCLRFIRGLTDARRRPAEGPSEAFLMSSPRCLAGNGVRPSGGNPLCPAPGTGLSARLSSIRLAPLFTAGYCPQETGVQSPV